MPTHNPYEQYMLELVNQARSDPGAAADRYGFDLGDIPDRPLQPLAMNQFLVDAARGHSDWMEATDRFSHQGVNGSSPLERAEAAGWSGNGIGENVSLIAQGGRAVGDMAGTVDESHAGLLQSPGHLRNIMQPGWSEAGIGGAVGDYVSPQSGQQFETASFYTQLFADSGKHYLTGVVFNDKDGDNFYDPGEGVGNVDLKVTDGNGIVDVGITAAAGGYQLALGDGNYTVEFSGGGLTTAVKRQFSIDGQNVKLDLNTETPAQPNVDPGKPEGQTAEPANPMMPTRPVIPVDSGRPTTEPMDPCVAMGSRLRNEQDQMAEWLRGDNFRSMGLDWNIFGTGAGNGSMSDNDMAGQMMQDFFNPRVSGFGNMAGNANQMMCNADQGMGMMCGDQQRPIAAMRASDNFGNFNDCGNAVGFMPDDDMMMI